MSAWLEYLQRDTPEDVLGYIPETLVNLTLRCRNGNIAITDPDTKPEKKPEYEALLRKLTVQRDFFAALLRYRDEELPTVLGPRWDKKKMDEAVEAIFQRHALWVQSWYPTNELTLPENKERFQAVQNAVKVIHATEEGQKLMQDAFDRFEIGYDYSDLPIFYRDICVAINAIGRFQLAVWTNIYSKEKAALKQAAKGKEPEKKS